MATNTQTARKRNLEDKRSNPKKWTKEEVTTILEYLKDTILAGHNIEKPTQKAYYKKLLETHTISDCDCTGVTNKVRALKNGYENAIKWRESTGKGVDDEETIREHILRICENFDILDEIFGTRVTIHVPYNSETNNIGNPLEANKDPLDNDWNFDMDGSMHTEEVEEIMVTTDQTTTNVEISTSHSNKVLEKESNADDLCIAAKRKKKEPSEFSNMVTKRQEVQLAEIKLNSSRLTLEKARFENETEINARKMTIEEKQFDLLETKAANKLKYKQDKLAFEREKYYREKEVELEKYKIEQECRMKLELAKLEKSSL